MAGYALVAQWIEQEPSNLLVAGSIPAEGASYNFFLALGLFFTFLGFSIPSRVSTFSK